MRKTLNILGYTMFQTLTMNGVDLSPLIEGKGAKHG